MPGRFRRPACRRSESPSLGVPDDIGWSGKRLPKEGDAAMPAPDTQVTERAAPSVPAEAPTRGRRPRIGVGTRLLRFAGATWRPAILLALIFAAWWFVADRELMANYLV